MRTTFVNTLTELAKKNEKVLCVIGDTGYSVFEDFEREFKDRFINVGIAEQNFVSFGAGLAAMGMKPYLYNVVSFMTLRATEQIMLDICYQENPVVLVGVGGGFAYANAGPTHHALQDVSIMTSMPNMTVVCPADPVEMRELMLQSVDYNKPLYIRIGRSVDPIVHNSPIEFNIGKAIKITEGEDAILLATGVMVKDAIKVYDLLKNRGISLSVYSVHTIKPIDEELIIQLGDMGKTIYTLEEHSIIGGLGDAVGRVLQRNNQPNKLVKFGIDDRFAPVTGSREYLNRIFGLSPNTVADYILEELRDK